MKKENLLKLLDCLDCILFVINEEKSIFYLGDQWSKYTGLSIEKCSGTDFSNYLHPHDKELLNYGIRSLTRGEAAKCILEIRIVGKDNTYVGASLSMIRDNTKGDGSHFSGMISVKENLSCDDEFSQLKEKEERLSLAMEGANVGIWDWDLKTNNVYYSPRWKEMLGYDESEIEPHLSSWERLIHPDDKKSTVLLGERIISGKSDNFHVEFRMKHKNGYYIHVLSNALVLRNANGEVYRLVGTHQDITERKVYEQKLIESEERYRHLSGLTFEGIVVHDKGKLLYVNDSCTKMFQYNRDELIGTNFFDFIIPEQFHSRIFESIQNEYTEPYEVTSVRKDGKVLPIEIEARTINYNGGKVRVAAVRDITRRKFAEKRLRESEEKLNIFFSQAKDGYFIMQLDEPIEWNNEINEPQDIDHIFENMRMVMVNDALLEQLGACCKEEAEKFLLTDNISHNLGSGKKLGLELLKNGRLYYEGEELRKDGVRMWIEGYYVLLRNEMGEVQGFFGMRKNITAQKEFEQELKQSKAMLQAVLDTIPVRVFWKDLHLNYLGCNPRFANDAGFPSQQDIIGKNDEDMPWISEAPKYFADEKFIIENDIEKIGYEEYQTTLSDNRIIRQTSKVPLKDPGGSIFGLLGTYDDITERYRTEEEINKLALVAQKTDNAVIITDKYGNIEWVNEGFTRLSEYPLEEVVGKKPGHFLRGEDTDYKEIRRINRSFTNKKSVRSELLNYSKSGKKYWISLSIQPILDESGNIVKYISVQSDITERKKNEEELKIQNEQLKKTNQELDNFVYRVSHDLKAPISSVRGLVNLARLEINDSAHVSQCLDMIERSAKKLDAFILDILDYSRNARLNIVPEKIVLKDMLEDTFRSLNHFDNFMLLKKVLDFPADITVVSDRRRLDFIFNNLISNAIRFSDCYKTESVLKISVRQMPDYCQIDFSDNGIGIEKKYLDKIFNMFFRATEQKTGSGLGLYIVKEAVEKLNGSISVDSEYGVGTTFTLKLPVIQEEPNVQEGGKD